MIYLKFTKKCKRYKERRKIKSECDFIGLKNKLNYKCKVCKKKMVRDNKWIN